MEVLLYNTFTVHNTSTMGDLLHNTYTMGHSALYQ